MPINIGLLGAATITPRSIIAPARKLECVRIHGVASSDINRAVSFAKKYSIPNVFSSYSALLECEDIDAVYIALPNSLHATWSIAAAKAKKHILVEKPICINCEEAARIKKAVLQNGVQILEGVMIQHHPWESRLKTIVRQRHLGELVQINTIQTFRLEHDGNYRFSSKYGGGVFFDESCYWLRLLQVLELLPIERIEGEARFSLVGDVDTTYRISARSKNGIGVEALFSYDLSYEATHYLTFSEGNIRIRNYLAPSLGNFHIRIEIEHGAGGNKEVITFDPGNYFLSQLEFFAKVISGELENIPLDQSLERISVMVGIHASLLNLQKV